MTTATMTRTYSSSDVRRLTGATMRELEYWLNAGIVTSSATAVTTPRDQTRLSYPLHFRDRVNPGSGNSRRYTDADIARIRVLKLLRTAGVELGRLRHQDLSAVRADIEAAFDEASRAGLCQ